MRAAFIGMFLLNLAAAWLSPALLPDPAAVHFRADGLADGWMAPMTNAALLTGLDVLVFFSLQLPPQLLRLPARWINLPNKDYWLDPARRPQARALLRVRLDAFGVALFGFLLAVNLLLIQANRVSPPRLDLRGFFPALGGFLAFSVAWSVSLHRAFRRTGDDAGTDP